MNIDVTTVTTGLIATATAFGMKLLGALAIWIVGKMLINFVLNLTDRALARQKFDTTLTGYLHTSLSVILKVALVLGVLGFFGVETSSFAALLAAAGVAIGMAWSGLLANFAAGVFLVLLRPFKTGDFVTAGGITGTIRSIGLFATSIDAPDGVHTIVGNGKIFADTIQNYSANAWRRVDLTAQLPHGIDPKLAVKILKDGMRAIPNVASSPEPECEILTFNPAGPVLAVRPYTNNDHYWQVYFDTNRLIANSFASAGFPVPSQQLVVVNPMAKAASA